MMEVKRGRVRGLGSIKELSHNASGSHVGVRDNEAYHRDRRVCLARACAYNPRSVDGRVDSSGWSFQV